MNGRSIPVRELTAAAFSPYGRLIEVPGRAADISRDNLDWWGGLYDLDFPDKASLGILLIRRGSFELTMMERHIRAPEIFIPIAGAGLLVFAPPLPGEDRPDMRQAVAFIVDGCTGLVIERGAWHNPGFALTPELRFILTVRKNTADDVQTVRVDREAISL